MLSFIAKSVKKIIPRRAAGGNAAVTLTRPPRRGINVPSLYLASKELSRLDEFLLSASSTVKGWVGILLYGFGFFLPRGPGVPCCT